jgi:signal transduction histidine kinase
VLSTRTADDGGSHRVLTVSLHDDEGSPWALQLAAPLWPLEDAASTFLKLGMQFSLGLGLALLGLQTLLARRLSARVKALTTHVAALREGDLSAVPPAPLGGDEIADLSRVVAEATERLRQARAAQDRLVADAAHELRTPLTLMRTSIDVALRRRRGVPELEAALEDARREVDRLARLSTRLLDLAAAGRGGWDRTLGDLRRTAEEAAEAVRPEAEAKGVLVEVRGEPVPAHYDPSGIRQALDNLLANAIRHSPAGKPVAVELGRDGGVARIAVKDVGPGIPEEERERVFQPFHRSGGHAGAAGLGLAIVREIARGHGGRAYVGSGQPGAELVLELPL